MVAVATEKGQHAIARMLENVYIDDCNYSTTTEEELREIEEKLTNFMHENGFITKAPTYKGTRGPPELSNSGFINTAIILQKSEYSRSDSKEEDGDEDLETKQARLNAEMEARIRAINAGRPVSVLYQVPKMPLYN